MFGPCSNPNYHGHNYELEVSVEGEIDPETGYVADLRVVKQIVEERVVQYFDHKNLNVDLPEFQSLNPTTETGRRQIQETSEGTTLHAQRYDESLGLVEASQAILKSDEPLNDDSFKAIEENIATAQSALSCLELGQGAKAAQLTKDLNATKEKAPKLLPSLLQKIKKDPDVKAAQEAAVAAIGPGIEARVPHEVATGLLVEAGFEKHLFHLTGHGLGFRYHEPEPLLMPGNTMTLRTGHVCSVEPGLYGPKFGGIRLEDNVAVTEQGVENLTRAAKRI